MAKNRLFRGILLTLAFMLCMTGVIGEIRRASAEETSEIVSSYPYTTVTKVKVNLREARSVKSGLVKRIPAEAEITVYEKNGNWARVEYNGSKGWVRTEYIVLKTVKKVTVTPTPTPAPTPAPEKDAGGYVVLKKGSKGAEVQALQEALIELGFLTGKADGNFGDATEKAVIAFQQRNKYPDTGLMDANIQAFLYSGSPLNAKGTATKINTVSPAAGATMRLNNTGEPVGQLQTMLQNLGYYTGTITKRYDMATRAAVTAFQKKNGLKADGVAGAEGGDGDGHVGLAELGQRLAAGAAGQGGGAGGAADNGERAEAAAAFGDGLEERGALGAVGEAVGGVLDVAAGEDGAVRGEERGADAVLGVGGVGAGGGGAGGGDEGGPVLHE